MDKRPELRLPAEVPVRVWGMDADGKPFFQNATAANVSHDGAQLSRLRHMLKPGEIIGIQYGDKKARFEIKWVKEPGAAERGKAGVRALPGQVLPWADLMAESLAPQSQSQVERDKRRFVRHRVSFPIRISFPDGRRSHMQCNATDIGGCGCYVETMVPLALGTEVVITFWIDSERFTGKGVVRASDPGVGMGIEFTTLESSIQQQLQAYLEKIDEGYANAAGQGA